jgi:hypothetical protein
MATMPAPEGRPVPAPKYLSRRQLANQSGLSEATIQRLKAAKRIPFYQPGGAGTRVVFPPNAIEIACAEEQKNSPPQTRSVNSADQGSVARRRPGPSPRWRSAGA